jgi:hypothetical protein
MNDTSPAAALAAYTALRLDAAKLMSEASRLPGLPRLYRAQADAIARLCTLKLFRVHLAPDGEDARAIRDDIETLATIVDALFEAIGTEAAANFHGIDEDAFRSKVAVALDEAVNELNEAAERLEADLREVACDGRRRGARRTA